VNILKGILLKLASALMFAVMQALVRSLGEAIPVGQVVFFRSAFAVIPVVVIYALRGELDAAVHTKRPFGHVGRGLVGLGGMFFSFAALARLPLAEVTAISFASPLVTVALAVLMLHERVRIYRWSAGRRRFHRRHRDAGAASRPGGARQPPAGADNRAMLALAAAIAKAGAVIQTRRLTDTETTSSIVPISPSSARQAACSPCRSAGSCRRHGGSAP
jgi:uncharacterized membrane protein